MTAHDSAILDRPPHERPAPAAARSGSQDSARVRVWDPFVRVFHWGLALAFLVAFLTEDAWLDLHTWAGYTALALVGLRILWGLVGPRHARFASFVKGPRKTLAYLRDELTGRAARCLGHNPAGGAMAVALILGVALTGVTGLAALGANHFAGPLAPWLGGLPHAAAHGLEEVHETLANLTLVLVPLHLAGVALSSWLHRENLVRGMIDGFKRGERG